MTYVALLYAVNVGKRRMKMADLREVFVALGFTDVRTHLQSGNVVFASRKAAPATLAAAIEAALEERFGFTVQTLVLSADELAAIVAANLFADDDVPNPSWLVVQFHTEPADAAALAGFMADYDGPEQIRVVDGVAFVHYGEGMGRSNLGPALKKAKVPFGGTARNIKVAAALVDMARGTA